ncbi:MAG TPA: DUF2950 domain-containing protein [Syntrophobacter fumaroxidans]|nr:DUF2950 domain-containing protein [Syntrophobacter fumaroxidans]
MFQSESNMRVRSFRYFGVALLATVMAVVLAGSPAWAQTDKQAAPTPVRKVKPKQRAVAQEIKQKTFASPEEALKSLMNAAEAGDRGQLLVIFGAEGKGIIASGDDVADKADLDRVVLAYKEMNRLEARGDGKVIAHLGRDEWALPIPIVRKDGGWVFDTRAGKEEIHNRRIGRNELNVMEVCKAYVDAQREYIGKDHDSDGVLEYAQKLVSEERQADGLYWPSGEGREESPMGPLMALAAKEGYKKQPEGVKVPYHGYFYRVLKAQGAHAQGGARNYVVKGDMTGGFALVAYPSEYGNSGIMTFIVNQDGIIYEKDFGKRTAEAGSKMSRFDPDRTWKKVEPPK